MLLAAAYYGAAKVGQTFSSTGPASAIWPPAGLGIAALYLWGMRWWPGVLLGEIVVTGELVSGDGALPVGSLLGQQAGHVAAILVGVLVLRRLIGANAAMDRVEQVGGMLVALGVATAISATVGTVSTVAGGVVDGSDVGVLWRTWWLGDIGGGLVVLPLMLAWARHPIGVWRRVRTWEGVAVMASVAALSVVALSAPEPVRYYVGIAALTALLLSSTVSDRKRSAAELAQARRREDARAVEERRRIARDLHDSVSQALFSTVLHTRTAQKALVHEGGSPSGRVGRSLDAIADLTRSVQGEMRALLIELHRDPVHDGLVAALARYAAGLRAADGLTIDVGGPGPRLALSELVETHLLAIGREALANVEKHARASAAHVQVEAQPGQVLVEVRDNGRGFDPAAGHPGHFGLDSMRSRAAEIGGRVTITSAPGFGTLVRVCVPVEQDGT